MSYIEMSTEPKKYDSYVKKLPMMIKTNGLGAALAFVFSKKHAKDNNKVSGDNKTYEHLYGDINKWLEEKAPKDYLNIKFSNEKIERLELVQAVVLLQSPDYRMTTIEVLAFLNWLKRFSEGMAKSDSDKKAKKQQKT